jgi:hypothetical protein
MAMRGADGLLHFPVPPSDRFAARAWLMQDGDARAVRDDAGIGRCDGLGCVMASPAGPVVLSRKPESLAEDCRRAAILVSTAAMECAGPRLVIDGPRAAHDQGDALWLTPSLKIESVRAWRGERPWVSQ